MKIRFSIALAAVVLVPILFTACGNRLDKSESIVFIETTWTGSNCFDWAMTGPEPTIRDLHFTSVFKKDVTDNRFLDVKLTDEWVTWRRLDEGNLVPREFHQSVDLLVPAGGLADLNNWPLMSFEQLQEPPFTPLRLENGGVDPETGKAYIRLEAILTFYGKVLNGDSIKTTLRLQETFRFDSGCTN